VTKRSARQHPDQSKIRGLKERREKEERKGKTARQTAALYIAFPCIMTGKRRAIERGGNLLGDKEGPTNQKEKNPTFGDGLDER